MGMTERQVDIEAMARAMFKADADVTTMYETASGREIPRGEWELEAWDREIWAYKRRAVAALVFLGLCP